MEKYFKILEIPFGSNENDIKKAYKKLAMKYHPDRNLENKEEASKKFKEVSDAYQILTDPDQSNIMQIPNFNNLKTPFSIFEELFAGINDNNNNNIRTTHIQINRVSNPSFKTTIIQTANGITIKQVIQ